MIMYSTLLYHLKKHTGDHRIIDPIISVDLPNHQRESLRNTDLRSMMAHSVHSDSHRIHCSLEFHTVNGIYAFNEGCSLFFSSKQFLFDVN